MRRAVADDTVWRLEIADGPNLGASVALGPGRYRLGSDALNDIVLADPAVSASHAVLELAAGRAGITALAPGVLLRRRQLNIGVAGALARGSVVTLGTTRLSIVGPAAPSRHLHSSVFIACLALFGLIGAGFAYYCAAPVAVAAANAELPPPQAVAAVTLQDAATALRGHLAALRGLNIATANGVVLATGSIAPQDRDAWRNAEKWFDARLGNRYALADQVRITPPMPLPDLQVAAVAMAPVPNVTTRDGEHYTVGAVLQNGWSIDRITPQAITLRNGAREMRITL